MKVLKVLIVDDSAAIRKILRRVFSQMKIQETHEYFEAADGVDALKILKGERSMDVVITDINMPNMDGIQLVKALRANDEYRTTPVLIVATEGGQAKVQEALEAGANNCIYKPFTSDALREKLTAVGITP